MAETALSHLPAAPRGYVASLLVVGVTILFVGSTTAELHGTPTFYAGLIREIVESGDPLHIFRGAEAYLLKPPLVLWLSALGCELFGLTNFGVTLVSRLAGVGVVVLCYLIGRRLLDAPSGWMAAAVLATNSTFIQFSATLRMDSMLLAGTLLSITGWLYRDAPWGSPLLFGGIAVAVLAKGPLGAAPLILIALHAALLGVRLGHEIDWRWGSLLLIPLLWYAYIFAVHGLRPLNELQADAMRASSGAYTSLWTSALHEYLVRPLRRYWPWLPFMVAGIGLAAYRALDARRSRATRAAHAWLLSWGLLVVAAAIVKPDHDIRYLYPATPSLAMLAAIVITKLSGGRLPAWLPAAVVVACAAVWVSASALGWGQRPAVAAIETIRARVLASPPDVRPVVLGGYPIAEGAPRRQNSERDWLFFYVGVVPRMIPWHEIDVAEVRSLPYVLTMRSRGYEARLADLGFQPEAVTKEMVLAVPR